MEENGDLLGLWAVRKDGTGEVVSLVDVGMPYDGLVVTEYQWGGRSWEDVWDVEFTGYASAPALIEAEVLQPGTHIGAAPLPFELDDVRELPPDDVLRRIDGKARDAGSVGRDEPGR